MKKTIYTCDISHCEFSTENYLEVYKSRILDKEYDLCETCLSSLEEFIKLRLRNGKFVAPGQQLLHSPDEINTENLVEILKKYSSNNPPKHPSPLDQTIEEYLTKWK